MSPGHPRFQILYTSQFVGVPESSPESSLLSLELSWCRLNDGCPGVANDGCPEAAESATGFREPV